jgi:glycosyltransferase involved in cell wall biosynthesis
VNPCIIVPIHDHGGSVGEVIAGLAPVGLQCLVVDDGSGSETREILSQLAVRYPFVELLRKPQRSGKGAALKTGYRAAVSRGFSHAVQLDADGQHDTRDVGRFVEAMRAAPGALVLGVPVFDASVPRVRLYARQLSRGLVWLACLSRAVPDPLCGFRGIPLGPALAILDTVPTGDWMDFEPELAVRLVWAGLPVVPLPTGVVYLPGGISHFSFVRDYPRLASLYTRLVGAMLLRAPALLRARAAGGGP